MIYTLSVAKYRYWYNGKRSTFVEQYMTNNAYLQLS